MPHQWRTETPKVIIKQVDKGYMEIHITRMIMHETNFSRGRSKLKTSALLCSNMALW